MPWTVADVEKHNKGLSDKKKKQWVAVANSHLQKCMADGGDESTCAATAIKMANGVVATNEQMKIYKLIGDNYKVRTETHNKKKYLVVPVVMMIEGVHNGSHGPLLHPIEELGKFPESWNGIPVVIDHPQKDGLNVSANSPDVIDDSAVGTVYNTEVDGTKLKAEVWLDEEKLSKISKETLDNINDKKPVEVSLGVFTEDEVITGTWNNETYDAIARNHRPDHLALLPGGIGACSIEDGCGIGANVNKKGGLNVIDNVDVNATVTGMEAKRQELGMSVAEFYAVPRDPPSDSKLPIFDVAHVRNAMARFNQTQGLSSEEKASAKSKIMAKAKKFKIDVTNFSEADEFTEEDMVEVLSLAGYSVTPVGDNSKQGYKETIDAVYTVLRGMDTNNQYHYLEEMYPDYIVYQQSIKDGSKLYKQEYALKEGKIEFNGVPTEVKRKVDYTPVTNGIHRLKFNTKKEEVLIMNENVKCPECVKIVNELITNKRFTEEQRPELEALSRPVLEGIAKQEVKEVVKEVQALTAEQQADLAWAQRMRKEKKDSLIKSIQDNTSKELWPDAELTSFTDAQLEKLAQSTKKKEEAEEPVNYTIMGANVTANRGLDEDDQPLYPCGIEMEIKK